MQKCTTHGFSLAEIVITISLFAMVTLVASLSFRSDLGRRKFRLDLDRLLASLEESRGCSLATDAPVSVHIQPHMIEATSLNPARCLPVSTQLTGTATIEGAPPPNGLQFFPSGAATPATLRLSSANSSCTITISLRGRIDVQC